ncbi:MAG: DNA polymerase III subunit gamma/tau [Phycisphaerae bacterium]
MAGYLVLARKYRSTTFDEVVGQEPIARTLTNAIKTGRVAHAYLFTGTRGVGKTTMARILAKALNCLNSDGPTVKPCNKCESCQAIMRGDDIDVIEMDGASNRGIDEIRDLRANSIFRPARSRFKIYYIDEVHQVTRDAFNALLKTLEEPPEHVKFIFATTEAEKVPATILSRCQRYDFRNIPSRKIAAHLKELCKAENVEVDDDALFRVARAGAGSMRDALSLLDQLIAAGAGKVADADVVRLLGTPAEEKTLAIVTAIAASDAAAALKGLNEVIESGISLASAAAAIGDIFRNMMLASTCGADSDLIELPDTQRAAVGELAKKFTTPAIVQMVGLWQSLQYKLRGTSVARALMEAALVRLAMADKFVDPASLLERLEAIGGGVGVPPASRAGVSPASGPAAAPTRYGLSPSSAANLKRNFAVSLAAGLSAPPVGAGPSVSTPAPSAGPLPSTTTPPLPSSAPATPIQWNLAWLAANWPRVIEGLTAARQMQVAGLLRVATVKSFDGAALALGFDVANETLRQRAAAMATTVNAALSAMAGRDIRCDFLSTVNGTAPGAARPAMAGASPAGGTGFSTGAAGNGAGFANGRPARAMPVLSTAEKAEIMKDPAVQAVLSAFGGEVVDIRKDAAVADAPEE